MNVKTGVKVIIYFNNNFLLVGFRSNNRIISISQTELKV